MVSRRADCSDTTGPELYRTRPYPNENQLLQNFRAMAPSFAARTPMRKDTDQWLCLAQHVGLPTRLLDWTESALFAAHCALKEPQPVVWMLDPVELNALSASNPEAGIAELPLPWHQSRSPSVVNIGNINIRGAWEHDAVGVPLPVAFGSARSIRGRRFAGPRHPASCRAKSSNASAPMDTAWEAC